MSHACTICGGHCDCDGEDHEQSAPEGCEHQCADEPDDEEYEAWLHWTDAKETP